MICDVQESARVWLASLAVLPQFMACVMTEVLNGYISTSKILLQVPVGPEACMSASVLFLKHVDFCVYCVMTIAQAVTSSNKQ